ncbi:MAG: hypothetical protein ACC645_00800 [Pirellulales bacterium]
MDRSDAWRGYFEQWPADVRRRGVLVTLFGEQIPFAEFKTHPALLLLERAAPDTAGARMVIVSYEQVAAVKIIDPLTSAATETLGFKGGKAVVPAKRR